MITPIRTEICPINVCHLLCNLRIFSLCLVQYFFHLFSCLIRGRMSLSGISRQLAQHFKIRYDMDADQILKFLYIFYTFIHAFMYIRFLFLRKHKWSAPSLSQCLVWTRLDWRCVDVDNLTSLFLDLITSFIIHQLICWFAVRVLSTVIGTDFI